MAILICRIESVGTLEAKSTEYIDAFKHGSGKKYLQNTYLSTYNANHLVSNFKTHGLLAA